MTREDQIKLLLLHIQNNAQVFNINETLFDIFEGDLIKYVLADLKDQLNPKSYEQAKHRVPSLNICTKLVDKLSSIYTNPPARTVEGVENTDKDQALVDWYVDVLDLNSKMASANEFYNLFKNTMLLPYTNEGKPALRVVPSMNFLPYGANRKDPTIVTGIILFAGKDKDTSVYAYYSKDEFFMFDSKATTRLDLMAELDNEDGSNPIDRIPSVYINSSDNLLIPKPDKDLLTMVKLLNVLVGDLNLISMFTSFPIRYGIDVRDDNLVYAPNAYWSFSSLGEGEKKPMVGTLDAKADLEAMLSTIQAELAMWLSTRGLKPSAMGTLEADQVANGISKLIDDVDTTEHRTKQVVEFVKAENDLWDLIINHLHPYWIKTGQIDNLAQFSAGISVNVSFVEQIPSLRRGDTVRDLKDEVGAGFTSYRRAIKKLNPHMTESEIDDLIEEIKSEGPRILVEASDPIRSEDNTEDMDD